MTAAEPVWLEEVDVLALHDRLLVLHGGPAGLRDEALLQSALARPRQLAAYGQHADAIDLASAYTAELVKNHPFMDGNKRTGFVVGILFLELNGYRFTATEDAAAAAVLGLAAGTLDERGYTAFLRENVSADTESSEG
jgi:death on curing protein